MCGIAGLWLRTAGSGQERIVAMSSALAHRGPDDHDMVKAFAGDSRELWLGHTRLAILDLSSAAHQPMRDPETGNWIVFNGEIYNHRDIREQLGRGVSWRSHSDTETILRAYARWGTDCLQQMRGMFAFALYDAARQTLWCVRDRFGIKPLYFADTPHGFAFASEVRSLMRCKLVEPVLDPAGLASYVRFGSVSEPFTLIAGIKSLPAATWMEIGSSGITRQVRYWDALSATRADENAGPAHELMRAHLERAVREHLLSDVPVACFLSGGVDSSSIAALAARHASRRLRTFTVGFEDANLDERSYAAEVARRYHTEHTEIVLCDAEAAALAPSGVAAMDQPSADALNTFIVAQAVANAGTKVALSGLGADELFGGYRSFRLLPRAHRWSGILGLIAQIPGLAGSVHSGGRAVDLLRRNAQLSSRYEALRSYWSVDELKRMKIDAPPVCESDDNARAIGTRISLLEINHYMRNVLLRDADGMAMAHGLELRVPFLDHELAASALSGGMSGRGSKPVLMAAVADLLPPGSARRPKRGFVLPMAGWMRGPLAGFVRDGLSLLRRSKALPSIPLQELRERFDGGKLHWSRLWQFVVLGHWVENVIGGSVEVEASERPASPEGVFAARGVGHA